jgi:hypothetical protein
MTMGRGKGNGARKFRIARFEMLESRHLLSITGLGGADPSLASTTGAVLDNVPAFIGQPLAHVESAPLAEFRLKALDSNNNPITSIKVGQDFQLAAFVSDVRDTAVQFPGVWAAYMNVAYNSSLVFINATPSTFDGQGNNGDLGIEWGTYFDTGLRFGDLGTAGQITDIGSASLASNQSGPGGKLLFKITVHTFAAGTVVFDPSFDVNQNHESSFIDPPVPLTADQIRFTPLELTIVGDPPDSIPPSEPPKVSFTPAVSHMEGDSATTPFVFTVWLTSASAETVTVVAATSGGSASSTHRNQDYTSLSTTLTFTPGQTSKQVTVLVDGDTSIESDETFNITLSNPVNAALGTWSTAVGTIVNDDMPTVSVADVSMSEGDAAGNLVFAVTISQSSPTTIIIPFSTYDGTAIAPVDYVATSGAITFLPGDTTTQLITVVINGDTIYEPSEDFHLFLRQPANAVVDSSDGQAVASLLNDDLPAVPTIDDPSPNMLVSGTGTVRFTPIEGGFHEIISDDGQRFDPINLKPEMRVDGLRLSFVGLLRPDLVSIPMSGPLIELSSAEVIGQLPAARSHVSEAGTVRFNPIGGGSFEIVGDDQRVFEPINLKPELQSDRLRLSFSGEAGPYFSTNMAAPLIELSSAEVIASDSRNRAITSDPGVQQMPSVAVDPRDTNHVVIAYMDYSLVTTGYAGIGVAVSTDAGTTWEYSSIHLPVEVDQGAADPVVKFDDQGHVFVVFMSATFLGEEKPPVTDPDSGAPRATGFRSNNGIYISRSNDGGQTWQQPICISQQVDPVTGKTATGPNRFDQSKTPVPFDVMPDLAIDTFHTVTAGGEFNSLYATWVRFYPEHQFPGEPDSDAGSQVMIAVSRDGGTTWQLQLEQRPDTQTWETVIVDMFDTGITGLGPGRGIVFGDHVTVGPDSAVFVSVNWFNSFQVFHSNDGGRSFVAPDPDTGRGLPFGFVPLAPTPQGIPSLDFRLRATRGITADPSQPGTIFAIDSSDYEPTGEHGDIVFARSTDWGTTWRTDYKSDPVRPQDDRVLNDDNGNRKAVDRADDVIAAQAMPWISTDALGNVAVIWYDTRRDPVNRSLDIFASVSTDHGRTFSSNFRITTQSFDADLGRFTNALGEENYAYLGDTIGLALAGDAMYAAWTDTRQGNQDIFFSRLKVSALPPPLNDRFEPNDTPDAGIKIGPDPLFNLSLSRLTLIAGDADWFEITSPTGLLDVAAASSNNAEHLLLQVFDDSGSHLLASSSQILDSQNDVVRAQAKTHGEPGTTYFVRVYSDTGSESSNDPIAYSLTFSTVTEDLGQIVHADRELQAGVPAYYLLRTKVAGSIEAALAGTGSFQGAVELLDPRNPEIVLASAIGESPVAKVAVQPGQELLIRATGGDKKIESARLEISNVDQFNSSLPDSRVIFLTAGLGPAMSAIEDLNHDSVPDLVVADASSNIVNVLIGNGDGTFQAARPLVVGAFSDSARFFLQTGRSVVVADVNADGDPDLVVNNYDSSDISVLLGRGDGTFLPQRRFDASASPFSIDVGDLNGDGRPDVAVLDSAPTSEARVAVLLNRPPSNSAPDWGFQPRLMFESPLTGDFASSRIKIADLDNDGVNDLLIGSAFDVLTHVYLGNGDGTFRRGGDIRSYGSDLFVADLDQDGILDIVQSQYANLNKVNYALGNGNGTFQEPQVVVGVGVSPMAVAVSDFGSIQTLADGMAALGPPDGVPDLLVANSGQTQPLVSGPANVVLLFGRLNAHGKFDGFGDKLELAPLDYAHDLKVEDLNGDGLKDVVALGRTGILAIFGQPPKIEHNGSKDSARDLGTVVHLVQPTLTITPSHRDAWYRLRVPTEAFASAGDQVVDFSAGFANEDGAGLAMEIVDAFGIIRGAGERIRVVARQNDELFVHIFGTLDSQGAIGSGAYTLVIDTLPQVADVEAQSFLPGQGSQPGGPTTSLVLVFQGDRLDATSAEVLSNYHVIWLGTDGVLGTSDDREIQVGAGLPPGSKAVTYDPGNNVDVSSGRTYPTAVRQTVTLLFGEALPVGSYRIEVSANVESAVFNVDELSALSDTMDLGRHPVVSLDGTGIETGPSLTMPNLVQPAGVLGDLAVLQTGNRFLTQFHNDLGAFLDAQLTISGDDPSISRSLLGQISARFSPALGSIEQRLISLLVIFLDPVDIELVDPGGRTFSYNLPTNTVSNNIPQAFVEVGGNVEVVVIPNPSGLYSLSVADVSVRARGGSVYLGDQAADIRSFTEAIRSGTREFTFSFGSISPPIGSPSPPAFNAISSGLVALRGIATQFLTVLSLSEASTETTAAVSGSSTSSTAPPVALAGRATTAARSTRQTSGDVLQAIEELLTEIWSGLLDRIGSGWQGIGANQPDKTPGDSRLSPLWQFITRILNEARKSNDSRSSAVQPRRANDSKEPPVGTPEMFSEQAKRNRAQRKFDEAQVDLQESGVSPGARARPQTPSRFGPAQPGDESMNAIDSVPKPGKTSTDAKAGSGSSTSAPSA